MASPGQNRRFLSGELRERLAAATAEHPIRLAGIPTGALPFVSALLPGALGRPVAIVVATVEEAEAIEHDAAFYTRAFAPPGGEGGGAPVVFSPLEPEPYLGVSPHLHALVDRAVALDLALTGRVQVLLIPSEALLLRVPSPSVSRALARTLTIGETLDREALVEHLVAAGYRRQDLVGSIGDLSVRGGILDVFSPATPSPYRIELLGDTIESIRTFDPSSQRSESETEHAVLLPVAPFPIDGGADERLRSFGATLPEELAGDLRAKRESLRARGSFPGIEFWAPVLTEGVCDLTAYLQGFTLVVVEPESVVRHLEKCYRALEEAHREAQARGLAVPRPEALALPPAEARSVLARAQIHLEALASPGTETAFRGTPARRYEGRIKELVTDLSADREEGLDAVVVLPTEGEAERVEAMLSEYGLGYLEGARAGSVWEGDVPGSAPGRTGRIAVATGRLSHGFRSPALGLSLYTAPDVFGTGLPPRHRKKNRGSAFASDFRDLKAGDFVVHVDHGLARFQGLKTVDVGGVAKEFMVLSYSGEDRLYVPLDRLDLVQKYQGMEGGAPRLDTLGGATWGRVKKKVKSDLREMAAELLRLYASRRVEKGYSYSPDGLFQKEFEDAFPYVETVDQLAAIEDLKRDMESSRCMDRLLCGDVGYGKTEVSMRAAFKAVADGKQVAVLAPTTVLAFQHFRTFTERFKAFPVAVGMVSRFRSKKEIDETLKETAAGKIDVLIGTHRILSKDVAFRDLGLLIVDEEQRFGVAHKEKLKQLRSGIDVLTMSATPIPRTLQMSLAGFRDMSVIETPPKDRLAIETNVLRFEGKVIREAIKQEMERGGQVFFVHNRVESIYAMADTIHKLAPFARITVAHGQMKEHELEAAMLRFVEREADVLIATTIIENGLDLPNVNTILINRANRLGLAQLYQLRGRVGRSERAAYAFLLVPRQGELTEVARKRLHAIQEFSDLGSGFRIAALDLQIRGAGNVLGREQHGHIAAIGFDLYMELLEQTIRELKGEGSPEVTTQVTLGIDVHVPEEYIADANQRLMVYKKVASLRRAADAPDLAREIADRFGPLPRPVEDLFLATRLKLEAQALGVVTVEREGALARLKFGTGALTEPATLVRFVAAARGRRLDPDGLLEFTVPPGREAIEAIREALAALTPPSAA